MRLLTLSLLSALLSFVVGNARAGTIYYKYPDGSTLTSGSTKKDLCVISNADEQLTLWHRGGDQKIFFKYPVNYEANNIYFIRNRTSHANSDFQFKFDYQGQQGEGSGHDLNDDNNHLYALDMTPDNYRSFVDQLTTQQSLQIDISAAGGDADSNLVEVEQINIAWPNFGQTMQHFQDCIANNGPAPGWVQRIDPELQAQQQEQNDNALQTEYNNSIDVSTFISYGKEAAGKEFHIKGYVYCEDLDSCNVIDDSDELKRIWFSTDNLSGQIRNHLLHCSYAQGDPNRCAVILSGRGRMASVTTLGRSKVEAGIDPSNIRFVSWGETANNVMNQAIKNLKSYQN
ncbi:hypothetical protein Gdia_2737 [Gluconacetobacter diazotrophicus PA1 5]|uniref:hypothetical protein n=1 Tax=Gluconacetobacter diazotrophicus TaxID=33996 RepID=UPI000173B7E4|nr:hypothetical protein [Gluconacetobacter diazotrophicus]ACI52473.1 hypothetical protein Gdia_2737 [Gluconacetobacter diazotrophicus PA1 5]TWA97884.1 hypothetical protein FBZ86_1743 [Gluconacetobacter diazotrophicus]